jgi:hypothetical protein
MPLMQMETESLTHGPSRGILKAPVNIYGPHF